VAKCVQLFMSSWPSGKHKDTRTQIQHK